MGLLKEAPPGWQAIRQPEFLPVPGRNQAESTFSSPALSPKEGRLALNAPWSVAPPGEEGVAVRVKLMKFLGAIRARPLPGAPAREGAAREAAPPDAPRRMAPSG